MAYLPFFLSYYDVWITEMSVLSKYKNQVRGVKGKIYFNSRKGMGYTPSTIIPNPILSDTSYNYLCFVLCSVLCRGGSFVNESFFSIALLP